MGAVSDTKVCWTVMVGGKTYKFPHDAWKHSGAARHGGPRINPGHCVYCGMRVR
jgi:formate hydrogenlyase subunit 6/NADH:ubiquinone oxidoreductase subunit I